MDDIVIRGGQVIDGTGAPARVWRLQPATKQV